MCFSHHIKMQLSGYKNVLKCVPQVKLKYPGKNNSGIRIGKIYIHFKYYRM